MAFWGTEFTFDGVSCTTYSLMLYDIGSNSASNSKFASTPSPVEEFVLGKWKPHFYGVEYSGKLSFDMVFGLNDTRIDADTNLTRTEMDAIANWLTGKDHYCTLTISQTDMANMFYKCMITGLEVIEYDMLPWAFKATVTCDSPYAYRTQQTNTFSIGESGSTITFNNLSNISSYYYPKLEITLRSGGSLTIRNTTDNNRETKFTNLPASVTKIYIDNDNCVITNDQDLNLYQYFNYNFFRAKSGNNSVYVSGASEIKFISEFPVNIGG